MSEWFENYKKEKVNSILKRGESFHELDLFCPYCGHEHEDIWESFDLTPNGEENEGECNKCEKTFFYKVELTFSTRKGR